MKTQKRINELNALLTQAELKNDEFLIETFIGTLYENKKDVEGLCLVCYTKQEALTGIAFFRGVIKDAGIKMTNEQFMECVEYIKAGGKHAISIIFKEGLLKQKSKVFDSKKAATMSCTTTFEFMNRVVIKIIERAERGLYMNMKAKKGEEYIKETRFVKVYVK